MPTIDYTDYEALTVHELKEMADQLAIDIPSDARKADIIDALKAAAQKEAKEGEPENPRPEEPVKPYQMSSTVEADIPPEDFAKLKLAN